MLSTRPNPFLNMTPWAQQQALQQQAALLAAQQQAVQASMFQQTAAPTSAATAAAPMGSAAIAAPQMGTLAANQAVMARPRMRDFPGAMSVQRPPRAPMLPSNLLQSIGAGVRSGLAGAATNPFVNPGAGALSAGAGAVRPLTPQMTAAPVAPQMGSPTLAPAAAPAAGAVAAPGQTARQPQPGAQARADDRAPLSDSTSQDIPDPSVREKKIPTLLDRLASGFSSMTQPDESGTSAFERMSPWLSMISNNEAKWLNDPSAGKSGWGQLGEDLAQLNDRGRQRQREDEQLKMAREEQDWNRDAAKFANEQRAQMRLQFKDNETRRNYVAHALLDSSLPEWLRKSLPAMDWNQQADALSKYYMIGPNGLQRLSSDGTATINVDARGNETFGGFTPAGERDYRVRMSAINAQRDANRYENSFKARLGAADAGFLSSQSQELLNGSKINRMMDELERILNETPQVFNQKAAALLEPEQYARAQTLFQNDPRALANFQSLHRITTELARADLPPGPQTNLDFTSQFSAEPGARGSPEFVRRYLQARRQEYADAVALNREMVAWGHKYGGLRELDERGRSFQDVYAQRFERPAKPTADEAAAELANRALRGKR